MKGPVLFLFLAAAHHLMGEPQVLQARERQIEVNGKRATVYSIQQPDGTLGLSLKKGESFDVQLENKLKVPTSVHWHGLILPNEEDGVANVTQYPIYPGESYHYQFPIVQSGTFWMHAHFDLQGQRLLSAPLILQDPDEIKMADKEVVLFLSDFSFKSPEQILAQLRCGMQMPSMQKSSSDLVDVVYDAYLANYRTLADPDVIAVDPGTKIRLRVINGASATNFFISLNGRQGEAIAVDGNRIAPMPATLFELADAQRIDLLLTIPKEGGAFPILAQAEGTDRQTGMILATQGAAIPKISSRAAAFAGALTNAQEMKFRPLQGLSPKFPSQKIAVELGGDMKSYIWTINGQAWPNATPLIVDEGSRVEITFRNSSKMAHPMHLHGHTFQVTAMDGKPMRGAMRDTVLVLPGSSLAIQFDADHPGVWPLHCHLLYHEVAGMMTVVRYKGFVQPLKTD